MSYNEYLMEQHTEGFCNCGADWDAKVECSCGYHIEDLKRQYNKLLKRGKKYASLDKETRIKYQDEFNKLIEKMDSLILLLGGNASKEELKGGFENV